MTTLIIPTWRRIYLASRYSRRAELLEYASELMTAGHVVTSRWLMGSHQVSDEGLSEEADAELRERFAREDWDDLMSAEVCVSFTEPPRCPFNRGGRHVEFGAAVAAGKRVIVVGHRENVFHCLPQVEFFPTWDEARKVLGVR